MNKMNYSEQAAERIVGLTHYKNISFLCKTPDEQTVELSAIIQDAIDKSTADSESRRARAVEALNDIESFVKLKVFQAASTQPPIKTVDEQDTTSTCPVCGRTAKEGCVGWHPTEKLVEETK